MSEIDLAALHPLIEPYIPLGRPGLLPALQAAQKAYGWLSEPVSAEIAKSLHVPLADVHGVIEFYTLFYNQPVGKRIIRVCTDQACGLKGGEGLLHHLCSQHGIQPGETTADGSLPSRPVPALGFVSRRRLRWWTTRPRRISTLKLALMNWAGQVPSWAVRFIY